MANDLDYTVNDPATELELVYIDDLIEELFNALEGKEHRCSYPCSVGAGTVEEPQDSVSGSRKAAEDACETAEEAPGRNGQETAETPSAVRPGCR